ncbi:YhcH/YjgK/YiaL family protein [Diplocloster modestus]|uniref:YhcH/YjgK/YiaL family protein n=1 Tax=Diplocloster modestus TaxID=2850322 RepID=A0ABS6K487_9FIRM|nr:YhcH/YjgK/YiaL family protein [Diplocloster modestus]MBU9725345.1 YhcH/YjgK/YiaL family protein [Diplocloster modestus]
MIIEKLESAGTYGWIGQELAKALDYLKHTDLKTLPEGRVEIDGDRMFAVVQVYKTSGEEELKFEAHRAYLDVQYIIEGTEKILISNIENFHQEAVPYRPEEDIVFYQETPKSVALILQEGDYAVFTPEDCHKTRCDVNGKEKQNVKKVIVKIRIHKDQEEINMGQKIGIHHLAVRVKDFESAKAFYTEGLGGTCYAQWNHPKGFPACMIRLNAGGILEVLGEGREELPDDFEERNGCFIHLALIVEDVEAAVERALEYGARLKGEIKDVDIPESMHLGAVYGPSGEIVEFLKYRDEPITEKAD